MNRPRLNRIAARAAAGAVLLGILGALGLSGCADNPGTAGPVGPASGSAGGPSRVEVTSTATECSVSTTTAPSGTVVFTVRNGGTQVTEFYLLAQDGLRIIGEVENIGPGLTRELVVQAAPGQYLTACKPGMAGEGLRAPFQVTDSGVTPTVAGADRDVIDAANRQYAGYVREQTDQLKVKTEQFAAAYAAGQDEQARARYAPARVHWERIETVAESFGDLDPRMDAREADLEPGVTWTGWHVIEKDLWPPKRGYRPLTRQQRAAVARQLVADTAVLHQRTRQMSFTATQIANGAKGLLDEVATGKVTGEEEIWSHTDLWDFQANVDGARVAWEGLRPLLQRRDPALDQAISARFATLQATLDTHRRGAGFVSYDSLRPDQVKVLSDQVNALSEPLSRLTAAVTL